MDRQQIQCRVEGCTNRHDDDLLCCTQHWFALPQAIRDRVRITRQNGPESEYQKACEQMLAAAARRKAA